MICEFWLSQRYLKSGKKERIISLTGLISMVGIAIGVAVLIVVIAVMSGFDRYLQEKLIGTNADITIQFYDGYRNPQDLMDKVNKLSHVKASAPYIAGQAFMKIGTQIIGMEMRGIDPKSQQTVTRFKEYIKKGTFDISGAEIIVGEELAVKLGLKIGDTVKLVSPATLTPLDFKVKGIFNSGMYLYDSGLVLTSLKGAQDFFRMVDTVSGIAVKTDDVYKVEAVKEEIYGKLGGAGFFDVMTWIDSNRSFLNALKLEKIVMFIVVTMTTVVAAFGIVSTLIMSVMSKIRDIGILRAIGARSGSILIIFVFQGITLGVTGIIAGVCGGITLALSLNKIIDFISKLIGHSLIPRDIYYFDRIPTYFNVTDISFIIVCSLVIILAASVYPAFYATRINPVEAIRHE